MGVLNGCSISDYDAPFLMHRNLLGGRRRRFCSLAKGTVLHV